jgi:hypothetical protein
MWRDPIVEEVRRNREEIFARFGNDLDRYIKFLQKAERQRPAKTKVSKSTSARTKTVRDGSAAKGKSKASGVARKPTKRRAA